MITGTLKVFSVGTDWFFNELQAQEIDVVKIDWVPPPEIPEDIQGILSSLKKR